ncbi:MAG TPA: M1 family aminopeptidase [Kofleriaceae bacterium]|jgi:aminopeptidase N|nr:M1 family aminopeptidase [Kofleriaceae bacterium]
MLRHIARFEWRYQLRSPVFWVGCGLFFVFTFGSVTLDEIQIGSRGNVNVNSPYAMLQTLSIMSLFSIFVIVAIVANVVVRDDETGFAPIIRATRVSKFSYLVGRFAGATAAAFGVLAMIPLAIAIGAAMPWLDPEKVGPFRIGDYLYTLFAFGLPTLLIISAGYFALATATRSMMSTYVGAAATLIGYLVIRGALRDPAFDTMSALVDPFGLSALTVATKYWTATERNTQLPEMTGLLLANRVLWSAVALALFAVAYRRFRFDEPGAKAAPRPAEDDAAPPPRPAPAARPLSPVRHDGRATRWLQVWRLARFDLRFVFKNPAFFVKLFLGTINGTAALLFAGRYYGSGPYPVTRLVVQALIGAFTIFPIIIAVFYSGELVWRDRDRKVHEIVDATAAPDWAHLVPKIVAITLVLAATSLAAVGVGVIIQLFKGYTHIELGAYLLWFMLPTWIGAVQLAVLSLFVQVLVPQKYIGWGVMLIYVVATVALSAAGFEHNLYNYGSTPNVPLSDMNGMGRFWVGQAWFQVYWTAFALVLAVLAYALWRRGTTVALWARIRRARLRGGALAMLAAALAVWLGSGAYIYYNTNVLNHYVTAPDRDARLARFEQQFLRYETVPQPKITAVTLDVQLYPREVRAVTTGRYRIQNRTDAPIDALHLAWPENLELDRVELAGARLDRDWPEYHYRIYKLEPAMQPGEVRELAFATTLAERGFPNSRPLTRIVENGTFLDNSEITPILGISRQGLLKDRARRRKYGLPVDLRPPTLEDDRGRAHNALRADSDWVDADITVTTDADQTPIAPGRTLSDATTGDRRTLHTRSDAPINHFFSIQSARYEVRRDRWNSVDLAVYYHPGHDYNVDRMIQGMKASLALFSEQFSPFQFHQARILEFPSYAQFAQSFANTIPYSEDIGFLLELGAPDKIDVTTYVIAHEIAHQWWGHQVVSSEQQGATMLIESFAQYSALLVMERMYGKEQIRKFLKYELDRYLRSRGGEVVEELPLARVENQPYIHYQKGSLVMYWLKEVVGEPKVNAALAALLREYAFKAAPYPNTRDFLRLLRAAAGPEHDALITDLFERITLVDAKATAATATALPDGSYQVKLEVEAHKFYADGKGVETEAPLDEPFDIGVFTAEPGKRGFTAASVLAMRRDPIQTGTQTVTVVVAQRPAWAGIDPYNKRIDRNSDDNLVKVEVGAAPAR